MSIVPFIFSLFSGNCSIPFGIRAASWQLETFLKVSGEKSEKAALFNCAERKDVLFNGNRLRQFYKPMKTL